MTTTSPERPSASDPGLNLWRGLCDDAAMFPPGSAPLTVALRRHGEHRASWYGDLVGPLVCAAGRVDEVMAMADEAGTPAGYELSVVVPAGAAFDAGSYNDGSVQIVALEVALGPDPGAPARAQVACRRAANDGVSVFVEVAPGPERLAVLDVVASAAGERDVVIAAKLRTGGLVAEAFPPAEDVAAWILACHERSLPFKCTAGLHSLVAHRGADDGFAYHGFGNVLLAAAAACRGAGVSAVTEWLENMDEEAIVAALRHESLNAEAESGGLAAARAAFLSFGTCSVEEPIVDLVRTGLVTREH